MKLKKVIQYHKNWVSIVISKISDVTCNIKTLIQDIIIISNISSQIREEKFY